MHVHYFLNSKGLPAAIITVGDTVEFHPAAQTVATYEVEITGENEVCATGYSRNCEEVRNWRSSTREALETFEAELTRRFSMLSEHFWTIFVDQMTQEIEARLRLREEWLTKQREKKELEKPEETNLDTELA